MRVNKDRARDKIKLEIERNGIDRFQKQQNTSTLIWMKQG